MGRYSDIIGKIVNWANSDVNVRFALIVGSQARTEQSADQWSDFDVALVTRKPEALIEDGAWLDVFGKVVCTFTEGTAVGSWRERRVLYADNRDIDFAILPTEILHASGENRILYAVLSRGFKVLLDKDGVAGRLASNTPKSTDQAPSKMEFENDVNDFYYHLVWTEKKLKRGELWTAIGCINGYLSRLLLRMLTWYSIIEKSSSVDTWFSGRFLLGTLSFVSRKPRESRLRQGAYCLI